MTNLQTREVGEPVYNPCCVTGVRITPNIYSLASIDEDSGALWIGEFDASEFTDITCSRCGQSYKEEDFTEII